MRGSFLPLAGFSCLGGKTALLETSGLDKVWKGLAQVVLYRVHLPLRGRFDPEAEKNMQKWPHHFLGRTTL